MLDMMKAGKLQEFKGILGYLVSPRPVSDKTLPPNLRKIVKKGQEENKGDLSLPLTGRNMRNGFEH